LSAEALAVAGFPRRRLLLVALVVVVVVVAILRSA
jgi:hypothetical protein